MHTPSDVLERIRTHGQAAYPEECCGFLLGQATSDGNRASTTLRVDNTQEEERERRYLISPDHYLRADREARRRGLDIIGIYHSHPDHPAEPSETDLAWATFPGYTYVIVSVRGGEPAELTAWSLAPDRSRFLREEIEPL